MRVQCCLCEYEDAGFCTKKKRVGRPIKIKPNKRRTCVAYSEEAIRVLTQYRKREAHRAALQKANLRQAQAARAFQQAKEAGLEGSTGSGE